jgi:sterol desaturase/sphingolipid hydroxylase (fatty acid hydroxylase superfamily)
MNDMNLIEDEVMEDSLCGVRDKRGHWTPHKKPQRAPLFVWPAQPAALAKWLFGFPGYLWPWNLGYAIVAALFWLFLTPPMETMKTIDIGWVLFLLGRNTALTILLFGGMHYWFYMKKAQGEAFKFNARWPETDSKIFLFRNQTTENIIWSLCSGVPIWTGFEVFMMWCFANGYIPYVSFAERPVYCVLLMVLVPLWRSFHFYLIHRLIHVGKLYDWVHKLHHNNVNPGPWSGLSMHPIEHLLFFSNVLIHLIVPAHPLHVIFQLLHGGMTPARGHSGFDQLELAKGKKVDMDAYMHYLHHRYFEVNYGAGDIPFDEWFGTWHDGSKEAEEAMKRRFKARVIARR